MIAALAAVVLAFIGATAMAVSGHEHAKGEPFRGTAVLGVFLISLALVLTAAS